MKFYPSIIQHDLSTDTVVQTLETRPLFHPNTRQIPYLSEKRSQMVLVGRWRHSGGLINDWKLLRFWSWYLFTWILKKPGKKKSSSEACVYVRSLAKVIWIPSITATFCFYSRCHKTEFCSWRYVFTTTKSITFCFEVAPRGFVATPLLWPWCLKPCSNCQLPPFHLCFSSSWSLYATRLSAPPWVALTLTPAAALMRANVFGSVPDGMVSGPVP